MYYETGLDEKGSPFISQNKNIHKIKYYLKVPDPTFFLTKESKLSKLFFKLL